MKACWSDEVRERHEAGHHVGREVHQARVALGSGDSPTGADGGHQAEGAVAQMREGMAGVDGERREDRAEVRRKYSSRKARCSRVVSFGRTIATPSAASRGWISSRKQRCCSTTSSWIRRVVAAGFPPVWPVRTRRASPSRIPRLSPATRTMKNSSRFELKMARNFTRSSSGTLGSCASSSTRRLNSSQDSSRLTRLVSLMAEVWGGARGRSNYRNVTVGKAAFLGA